MILPLFLLLVPGTPGPNRFGPQPTTKKGVKIAAWVIAGALLLCIATAIITTAITTILSSKPGQWKETPRRRIFTTRRHALSPTLDTQTVSGTDVGYSLTIPSDWAVKKKGQFTNDEYQDFDLIVSHKTDYVGVIAEEANLGTTEFVMNFIRKSAKSNMPDIQFSDATPVVIDAHSWRTFTARATVQGIPFEYIYYVYTGVEGTFQVVGWTFQNLFDRESDAMRRVGESFKFPALGAATTTNDHAIQISAAQARPVQFPEERNQLRLQRRHLICRR